MNRLLKTVIDIPSNIVMLIIRGYQRSFSPDHGWFRSFYPHGVCRFRPTCSEYTHQAIGRYGLIRGSIKGVWRIVRCNPWSQGGNDPLL